MRGPPEGVTRFGRGIRQGAGFRASRSCAHARGAPLRGPRERRRSAAGPALRISPWGPFVHVAAGARRQHRQPLDIFSDKPSLRYVDGVRAFRGRCGDQHSPRIVDVDPAPLRLEAASAPVDTPARRPRSEPRREECRRNHCRSMKWVARSGVASPASRLVFGRYSSRDDDRALRQARVAMTLW